jgi:hypothetical protein
VGGTTFDLTYGINAENVKWTSDSLEVFNNPAAPSTAKSFIIELRFLASQEK